jgi:hypothetical protein
VAPPRPSRHSGKVEDDRNRERKAIVCFLGLMPCRDQRRERSKAGESRRDRIPPANRVMSKYGIRTPARSTYPCVAGVCRRRRKPSNGNCSRTSGETHSRPVLQARWTEHDTSHSTAPRRSRAESCQVFQRLLIGLPLRQQAYGRLQLQIFQCQMRAGWIHAVQPVQDGCAGFITTAER